MATDSVSALLNHHAHSARGSGRIGVLRKSFGRMVRPVSDPPLAEDQAPDKDQEVQDRLIQCHQLSPS